MKLSVVAAIAPLLLTTVACTQERQKSTPIGPCIGDLCLGSTEIDSLAKCSDNYSNSGEVEIRKCSLKKMISIAGVESESIEVTVVNNKLARAEAAFEKLSCDLISSGINEKFGASKSNKPGEEYDSLYQAFGYPPRVYYFVGGREAWKSQNGFFFLTGVNALKHDDPCILYVESDSAKSELENAIRKSSANSISG